MHTTPMTLAHLPAAATSMALAFEDDDLFALLNPRLKQYPTHFRAHFLRSFRRRIHTPSNVVHVAISDPDDQFWDPTLGPQVLGIATWSRIGKNQHGVQREEEEDVWPRDSLEWRFERLTVAAELYYIEFFNLDPSVSYPNRTAYNIASSDPKSNTMETFARENASHMYLNFLGVHPAYQRKGVGQKLLEWGCKTADRENVPIGLIASPLGVGLYTKAGWKGVGWARLTAAGTELVDRAMVRWPNGAEGTVGKAIEVVEGAVEEMRAVAGQMADGLVEN